jgi:hypothetical protein
MLRCSEGRAVGWNDSGANQWQLFLFRWARGKNSAQLAKSHTPEICLQGIGYQLQNDIGTRVLPVGDLRLPFHQYIFARGGLILHVFYCLWEDRPPATDTAAAVREDGTQSSRLLAVREGRRHLGQQALEVAIRGPATPEAALAAFQDQLLNLIQK